MAVSWEQVSRLVCLTCRRARTEFLISNFTVMCVESIEIPKMIECAAKILFNIVTCAGMMVDRYNN